MSKVVIKIENCYSWLKSDEAMVLEVLWKSLRFREKGYFHSRLYKQKVWDGFKDFFNKNSGKFLTGLLPEVLKALEILNIQPTLIDDRNTIKFKNESIDENFLPGITLYDYQVDLINKVIKNHRGIIHAPTSSGKSNVMVSIMKNLPYNCPTLVLANKKSLVEQNYNNIIKYNFDNVGRLYDKYKDPNIITCATAQSIHKIQPLLPKFKALIVDEIHENGSKTSKDIYNKLTNCSVRIGLSATPFKFGGTDKVQKYTIKGYFGPELKTKGKILTTKGLQERNILSSSKCIFYNINQPQLPYDIYLDAVKYGIAESYYFNKVVSILSQKLEGRTLILVDRLAHGDMLSNMIPNTLWVQGKDNLDSRNYVIEKLQNTQTNVIAIATQGIFNAGINVFVHNLINAAGGQADHQIIQRMGRGLRTAKDKDVLNYYDFMFNINEYLLEHSKKRYKILKEEGHEIEVKDIDFCIS